MKGMKAPKKACSEARKPTKGTKAPERACSEATDSEEQSNSEEQSKEGAMDESSDEMGPSSVEDDHWFLMGEIAPMEPSRLH